MFNDYEKYDLFLITKENWRSQKNVFFGYKTVGNEGFWLNVENKSDKLIIKGSYLQPAIAIYSNNNFWAISNSVKMLKNYLDQNNYQLTYKPINIDNLDCYFQGYCRSGYSETDTEWEEIKLTPNFSYIEIENDNINIINIENKLFTLNVLDNKKIIDDWFKKYYFYIYELGIKNKRIKPQVSGGLDSRFLINFWKNVDVSKIVCNWKKDADPEFSMLDGLIGRVAIAYFSKQQDKIDGKEKLVVKTIKEPLDKDEADIFWYGLTPEGKDTERKSYIENKPQAICFNVICGVGTEWLKGDTSDPYNFIVGTVRRFFIPKFISNFYFSRNKNILPYLDSNLLKLKGEKDFRIMILLFLTYNKAMLEYPFFGSRSPYWITESDIEFVKEWAKEWK